MLKTKFAVEFVSQTAIYYFTLQIQMNFKIKIAELSITFTFLRLDQ